MVFVEMITHGDTTGGKRTSEYKAWEAMRYRCLSPDCKAYKNYGGRGIKVCERWLGDSGFENFLADLGRKPAGSSLDRIDNNGNYEPSNCKWSSYVEQNRNRRVNKLTLAKAREIRMLYQRGYSISELAKEFAISRSMVSYTANNKKYKEE